MTDTSAGPVASAAVPISPASDEGRPRIVLSGATGRLGRAFAEVALERGWSIAGALAGPRSLARGRRLSEFGVVGATVPVVSADRLPELLRSSDVYVACAPAGAEVELLREVAHARRPVVLATTGFTSAQEATLDTYAQEIPILRESNFSLGLYWTRSALARARPWPEGFDRAILEAHRRGKRDRPSGTARTLAEDLGAPSAGGPDPPLPSTDPGWTEVQSLRVGELPGIHQVWLASASELIRVEHLVLDRRAFGAGMAEGVRWLATEGAGLAPGWYGLADALRAREESP
jgi:4-hydroxy-tetrahydrodipicolinate reductase